MDVFDRQLVFGDVQQQPLQRALGVILLEKDVSKPQSNRYIDIFNPKVAVTSTSVTPKVTITLTL